MDIKRIKQLAGLIPLYEGRFEDEDEDLDRLLRGDDSDDGLSDAERELANQADSDLAAKGIDVGDADPDADLAALAASSAPEDDLDIAAANPAPELPQHELVPPPKARKPKARNPKNVPPVVDAPVVDAPAVANDNSSVAAVAADLARGDKAQKARAWLQANPGASRGQFIKYTMDNLQFGKNYANTLFYLEKKKAAQRSPMDAVTPAPAAMEFWLVKNADGKVLSESGTYDLPLWSDYLDTSFDARIFDKEIHARKAVEILNRYGFKNVSVAKESLE